MVIKISEVEEAFKDLFSEDEDRGLVRSIESVYEKPSNSYEYLKLVISIHGLNGEDLSIIHTKFIFDVNNEKTDVIKNSFSYLYEINCVYHEENFSSKTELKNKIDDIIVSNNFGTDIQILSDFIEAPAMFLNYYMRRNDITSYSVFNVIYDPKFKVAPCENTTFDFKININNNYHFDLSIKKVVDGSEKNNKDIYKLHFKFMDEIKTVETDTLTNIHFVIGSNIANILDERLKNK